MISIPKGVKLVGAAILLACCTPYFVPACGPPNAQHVISAVPIGSGLAGLDKLKAFGNVRPGHVMRWTPTSEPPDEEGETQIRMGGVVIRTEFGVFRQGSIGLYEHWRPSASEREEFTGEIVFYVDMLLGNVELAAFKFIDGKLAGKDWGYLPG